MHYSVKPHGVCPTLISFDLDGDIIHNVSFEHGCSGNLKAVSRLVDGMTVEHLREMLEGNTCGTKSTSCADQLVKAVLSCYRAEKAEEGQTETSGKAQA